MNAREELKEIITESLIKYTKKKLAGAKVQTITAEINNIRESKEHGSINEVAQAILAKLPELGFVRLEDVGIDKGKLLDRLKFSARLCRGCPQKNECSTKGFWCGDYNNEAELISSAKGIMKVQEGK